MLREVVAQSGAKPTGPYSQGIVVDGPLVFVAGQGPVDPKSGQFVFGSFREQAELTFRNVSSVLEAAGTSFADVVRVGVYLADRANFAELNQIYQRLFKPPYPARTTIQVILRPQMAIEVDCVAVLPKGGS